MSSFKITATRKCGNLNFVLPAFSVEADSVDFAIDNALAVLGHGCTIIDIIDACDVELADMVADGIFSPDIR